MADKDVVVQTAYRVPDGSVSLVRPCHLVVLKDPRKLFIALERPTLEGAYIQTKGVYVGGTEDDVILNWQKRVKELTENKANIVELYISWLRVEYIRNLAYTAK